LLVIQIIIFISYLGDRIVSQLIRKRGFEAGNRNSIITSQPGGMILCNYWFNIIAEDISLPIFSLFEESLEEFVQISNIHLPLYDTSLIPWICCPSLIKEIGNATDEESGPGGGYKFFF
jgi:hypothetical protein